MLKKITDINETWKPYLTAGEEIEKQFLEAIRHYYPSARKIAGNYKFADFVIPELNDLLIEIKRDLKSDQTRNFAFEIYFRKQKSGLSTTKAQIWVMADGEKFYLFDTEKLKSFFRTFWQHLNRKKGGDGNEAEMIIINKVKIINQNFVCSFHRDLRDIHLFNLFMVYSGYGNRDTHTSSYNQSGISRQEVQDETIQGF